jgi:hypothetical protein
MMVKRMLAAVWNVLNSLQFQVDAIATVAFSSANGAAPSLCLVRKKGEGKSIVLYGMATMRLPNTV